MVENRDATCYPEITKQTLLSAGTLLLSNLVLVAYIRSNFRRMGETKQCLPASHTVE